MQLIPPLQARWRLALVFAVVAATAPAFAQSPTAIPLSGQPSFQPETVLQGADVPFAVRAEALLGALAKLHAEDLRNSDEALPAILTSFGLEPSWSVSRDLVDAAVGLENDHPKADPLAIRIAKTSGSGMDLEKPGGWIDQRFAKAGSTFGAWLRQRADEGLALEPLLDRLLNNGQLAVTVFSDESESDVLERLDRQSAIFHRHLAAELGHLPRRFAP